MSQTGDMNEEELYSHELLITLDIKGELDMYIYEWVLDWEGQRERERWLTFSHEAALSP